MVRHVPWDEMPKYYAVNKKELQAEDRKKAQQVVVVPEERSFSSNLNAIGKRFAFGALCGAITGGAIATVNVMRDVKAMAADRRDTTQRILRFTMHTSCFFSIYHGLRKSLEIYSHMEVTENILLSGAITLLPLGAIPSTRPVFGYGVLLVFLDFFNEMSDQK